MNKPSFYEADGVRFLVPVTFDVGADITSIADATLTARAKLIGGASVVEGVVLKVDEETLQVSFGPFVLTPGIWQVQPRIIPTGHAGQTLREPVTIIVLATF